MVNLDLPEAVSLGLVSITPDATKIGTPVVIDPKKILESTSFTQNTTKIGVYFGPALGVTFAQLAAYQKAGFGLGEITQACWMAVQAGGNATLLDQILTAKKTGNFSALVLPGGKTASNWGQLRKLLLTDCTRTWAASCPARRRPYPLPPRWQLWLRLPQPPRPLQFMETATQTVMEIEMAMGMVMETGTTKRSKTN